MISNVPCEHGDPPFSTALKSKDDLRIPYLFRMIALLIRFVSSDIRGDQSGSTGSWGMTTNWAKEHDIMLFLKKCTCFKNNPCIPMWFSSRNV